MIASTPDLTLATVNPAHLGVLDQARADATPDAELVASVKQHGILQPPTVAWNDDQDGYVIVTGHRRVGAAIQAGLTEITVIVRHGALADEALKLEQQIVENERRKGLTARELAQGYQKLQLFGRTPEEIAREIAEKPERVRAGLKIIASEKTSTLVEQEPSIDFEQAAIIAEFDEHPKLQKKLIETATTRPENFRRDVESAHQEARFNVVMAELRKQLEDEDTPLADVVTYDSTWWTGKSANQQSGRVLSRLGITVHEHRDCPGHAAIIHRAGPYYVDLPTGPEILYVCTDWEANGHQVPDRVVEKTPEQLEREAEWARQDEKRRKQRELVDANTRARRAWIHAHLTTGRLRPAAAHFDLMALALAAQIRWSDWVPSGIALDLLTGETLENGATRDSDEALAAIVDDPAIPNLRIIIATAIATFESSPTAPETIPYWGFLESQGYQLTDTDREHLAAATAALAEETGDVDIDEDEEAGERTTRRNAPPAPKPS